MASNVPYSMKNELLNSADEEDSDVSEIATRTRRSKKKERAPRPLEPNVEVQNNLEHAERSGEFQASSSSYGANSDRRKTESVGGNSLEFDSQEDVSNFKKEALFWLRHPRIRENWKTVTAAFLLFVAGIAFLLAGIILAATKQDGMKSVIFFVCAAICILPGGYHIIYIYRATKGQRGYNFESIPSFQ
ncbi:transmembrane protein 134-like isoform X2 [Orbicella faveolata]|uniref:transmembrane protein 134-like isoform X2 n=1 Tax=Orbicella faveolata TaxID=48498 RepID=UPI0009E4EE99|nr:transmembrane protein 134-like isoform X2 [Orbicella faveolata]